MKPARNADTTAAVTAAAAAGLCCTILSRGGLSILGAARSMSSRPVCEELKVNTPENAKAILPECPYCDEPVENEKPELDKEIVCPHCGSKLLLVNLDGVWMYLRSGWQ